MKKNYKTIGIISLAVIIGIFLIASYIKDGRVSLNKNNNDSIFVDSGTATAGNQVETPSKEIVVEIKGEINNPNIYRLNEESIIEDVIKRAGGLTDAADISKINRAEKLKNHQSIVIPNTNDKATSSTSMSQGSSKGSPSLVNINTASETELDTLPGVGPSRAKDIIKYREDNGDFKTIEELKNIKGIGESSFQKLKDMVTT